jgi:hypothetical protein
MDYFIKATDEQALWTSLESCGFAEKSYDPEDTLNQRPVDLEVSDEWQPSGSFTWVAKCQLDIIGVIFRPTGETQVVEGIEMSVMEQLDGFYANLRAELSPSQEEALPLIDKPNNPQRVWAGD